MATIKYFSTLGDDPYLYDLYDFNDIQLEDGATSDHAVYIAINTGNRIVITGKDLSYSDAAIVEGSISKIVFTNADEESLISVSKAKAAGEEFYDAFETHGLNGLLSYVWRGSDKIVGSSANDNLDGFNGKDNIHGMSGDDSIFGGSGSNKLFGDKGNDTLFSLEGRDRMAGGKGSDMFSFYGITGKDVIVDFDAKGGGEKQDYLRIYTDDTFSVKKAGHDLLIKFDDGDVVRLLDVSHKQFNMDDVLLF